MSSQEARFKNLASSFSKSKSYNMTNTFFNIGRLLQSKGINIATELIVFNSFVWAAMERHKAQDWGDLSDEDIEANNEALQTGERILSAYNLPEGMNAELRKKGLVQNSDSKIWIITERDRSATTILFPSEY